MSKKLQNLSVSRWGSFCVIIAIVVSVWGCDRGATEQIQAAERFAEATSRNNVALRDSMIATRLFKSYFKSDYVANEYITWIQSLYDFHSHKFLRPTGADVDRDLKAELTGALIDPAEIEETGMVKVGSRNDAEPSAFFWMVKQKGAHWRVAMITKGEMDVNFNVVN